MSPNCITFTTPRKWLVLMIRRMLLSSASHVFCPCFPSTATQGPSRGKSWGSASATSGRGHAR